MNTSTRCCRPHVAVHAHLPPLCDFWYIAGTELCATAVCISLQNTVLRNAWNIHTTAVAASCKGTAVTQHASLGACHRFVAVANLPSSIPAATLTLKVSTPAGCHCRQLLQCSRTGVAESMTAGAVIVVWLSVSTDVAIFLSLH
eukprot:GHUV01020953.1.p1 GENE.GHUV01020953.1~~GHUV01020953.1.p1  ORF type:complete len:144 (-),score=17.72 GHUV01020953.1:210-641(-)